MYLKTPLLLNVTSYTKQMAEFLLDMGGADVNAVNRFGDVPLMDVIMGFDFDTMKMLIK